MGFWVFAPPDNSKVLATWGEEMDFEGSIVCSFDPGHTRPGRRKPKLEIKLPAARLGDVIWTWLSECLISDKVLSLLNQHRFTGFQTRTAEGTTTKGSLVRLHELVVTGWGGMATASSGIRLIESCEVCKHRVYSEIVNPSLLMDEAQWDGCDFFIIWPLPRYIFVTDRVRQAVLDAGITGGSFRKISDLRPSPDGTLTPGSLAMWFPDDQAKRISELLGI